VALGLEQVGRRAAVHGQRQHSKPVFVEQQPTGVHIGERAGERRSVGAPGGFDPRVVPQLQPEFGDLLGLAVEDQVAKGVGVQDVQLEPAVGHHRDGDVQAPQAVRRQRLAEVRDRHPRGERGGHGGEDVAPVEGRRDGLQALGRALDVVGLGDAAEPFADGHQQPVVRADEQAALIDRPHCHGAPPARSGRAHPGIDDGEDDRVGQVGERRPQHDRPGVDVVAGERVGQVDHARLRAAARDHRVADTDELVAEAVVGQERDDRGCHRSDCLSAASASSAPSRPSTSWRSASTCGSSPDSRNAPLVTGPIETSRLRGEIALGPPAARRKLRTLEDEVNVM
jgi:hypothetical protein